MGKNKSRHFFGKQNPLHSTFTCGSMTFTFQEENIPKIATKVWKHLDSTHWNLFFFCSNVLLYWRVSSFHPQTPLKKPQKKTRRFFFGFKFQLICFFLGGFPTRWLCKYCTPRATSSPNDNACGKVRGFGNAGPPCPWSKRDKPPGPPWGMWWYMWGNGTGDISDIPSFDVTTVLIMIGDLHIIPA